MGAKHSAEPRTVRMENTTMPVGVIDVSDEVVERLKLGLKKQVKANVKDNSNIMPSKNDMKISRPPSIPSTTEPPAQLPKQQTIVYSGPSGITITAADVLRQKEEELKQNDAMWRNRMSELEANLKKTNAVLEAEYETAVNDVRKRFASAPPTHQLPPCQDLKAQVIACYRSNPGETLKCVEQVTAFRNCVNLQRVKKLDVEKHEEKENQTKNDITAKGA